MRTLLSFVLVTAITAPAASRADWYLPAPAPRAAVRGPSGFRPPGGFRPPDGRARLAPPPGAYGPAPRLSMGGAPAPVIVSPAPYLALPRWGWGYQPLWGPSDYGTYPQGYPGEFDRRISARFDAFGSASSSGAAGTLGMTVEGRDAGFAADVTGLALHDPVTGDTRGALTLTSARVHWSVASDASGRLKLELGGTMLSVPTSGANASTTFAGTNRFGPQVGVSGQVGLAGPFGLEGYARVTPWPAPIIDARAAMVYRTGPLAVSAGWRVVDLNGDGVDAPSAHFDGPELGLQLGF